MSGGIVQERRRIPARRRAAGASGSRRALGLRCPLFCGGRSREAQHHPLVPGPGAPPTRRSILSRSGGRRLRRLARSSPGSRGTTQKARARWNTRCDISLAAGSTPTSGLGPPRWPTDGGPVFIRFAHEMNHQHHAYPWSVGYNGNTAADYVAAWRRIHSIFRDAGADNVRFVWCPNVNIQGSSPFRRFHPGDQYVDWIGLDGYNGGSGLDWGGWLTFSQVFEPSYVDLKEHRKPMVVCEVGSSEQGGDKAAWIEVALAREIPSVCPVFRRWSGSTRSARPTGASNHRSGRPAPSATASQPGPP